ncbi:hypothetical protein RHGRI_016158 [Rhododendron griersonianum]|uniref:Uncharacterized protein n=1 Tax=Rhododendron griersonianum TaxID=479676 RepID=A0AAV6JT39_9ERIC|nr:hypothetical protein RHGRI_016158 [Rhododendron griersonianum]
MDGGGEFITSGSNHRLAMLSRVGESVVKCSVKEVNNKWVKEGSCLVEMKRWMEDITLKLTAGVIAGFVLSLNPFRLLINA